MNCPWIRSANPNDQLSTVCDLSKRRTLCSGIQAHCECPNLLDAEMELEYEKTFQASEDHAPGWMDRIEEERFIRGR